jgi:hypothetical protein
MDTLQGILELRRPGPVALRTWWGVRLALRVWFTLGFGIVNEAYYPRVGTSQIRDLGVIVADGRGVWVEVKRLGNYTGLLAPCTPAPV